ncbi:hypothetical protein Ocin01_13863 [Orchesella cincta]|uniref:Uncharacterized protein n=1 Tax=Orchesella cincta TaxID=48709 RepID=A0A1D2MII6_ORCCI|nr:hypothetical protein Ocin01_13863 [Orchesella cincta]
MWIHVVVVVVISSITLPHVVLVEALPVLSNSRNHTSSYTYFSNGVKTINYLGPVDNQVLSKWTSTALKFFDFHKCVVSNIASSEDECFRLNQLSRSEVAVYFAGNTAASSVNPSLKNGKHENSRKKDQKVVAVFPDSSSPKSGGSHDAVLVLDPYPKANFGHLVAVFYIDLAVDSRKCKDDHQIYTTDETCISVAKKSRCPNRLERYTSGGLQPRRCHIEFLPTVFLAERFTTSTVGSGTTPANVTGTHLSYDLLNCVELNGFSQCPTLRPLEDTRRVLCDGAAVNSKRCDTSHAGVGTRCKLFQTCDRAVLIGGGWNRLHSDMKSFDNIIKMQSSLSAMGFLPENIKTFFANGKSKALGGKSGHTIYDDSSYFSSAMKTGLRGHLRTICETRHCADTLYIYLNNPTTIEGDMLLWDADYNGQVDELEIYTVKEFLSDILGCEARRVILVVDQSNSDILLSSLKESTEHRNVVGFFAGINQPITNGEFTQLWANYANSPSCIKYIQQNVVQGMLHSNPVDVDSTSGIPSKVSLIGAPCDLNPPVNSRELKSLYEGCQNVPTSVWFSATFEDVGGVDYDSAGSLDESEENSPNGRRI